MPREGGWDFYGFFFFLVECSAIVEMRWLICDADVALAETRQGRIDLIRQRLNLARRLEAPVIHS